MKKYIVFLLLGCAICTAFAQSFAQTKHLCATCAYTPQATPTASERASNVPIVLPNVADSTYILDLLFVFDASSNDYVTEQHGGIEQYVAMTLDTLNKMFGNSLINVAFRAAGTMEIPRRASSITDALRHMANNEAIAKKRRATKADLVIYFSEPNNDGQLGLASLGPNRLQAHCAVLTSSDQYTIAHEIRHLFGCHHSRNDGGTHPYAVAALRGENHKYSTIMSTLGEEHVPLFSAPTSVWKGIVMGSETENCVRLIRENAALLSSFGDYLEERFYPSYTQRTISNAAQSFSLDLRTNNTFFISSDAPWLTLSQPYGWDDTSLTLTAEANPKGTPRTAHITISRHTPNQSDEDDEKYDKNKHAVSAAISTANEAYPDVVISITQGDEVVTAITPVAAVPTYSLTATHLIISAAAGATLSLYTLDGRCLHQASASGTLNITRKGLPSLVLLHTCSNGQSCIQKIVLQ